jgi:hypothetical protein
MTASGASKRCLVTFSPDVASIVTAVQYDYSSLVSQFPRAALGAAVYDAPGTCADVTGSSTPLNQCFNAAGTQVSLLRCE